MAEKHVDPRKFGIGSSPDNQLQDFSSPLEEQQPVNVRIFKGKVPSVRELGEGQHAYSVVAGVRKMHVKIAGILVSTTLTP